MSSPRDKDLIDEILRELGDRKGFEWWWEEIGSRNRADIKRRLRAVARRHLKGLTAGVDPQKEDGDADKR